MEVTTGKHVLVSRNVDHVRVKVGADGIVFVEIGSGWTRHNEYTIAGIVVFCHT